MKAIQSILLLLSFIILAFLYSCKPSDTVTYTGNWKNFSIQDFEGAPRSNATSFVINNKVYVGLGYNGNTGVSKYYKNFYVYDPSIDRWTAIADFGGMEREFAVGFSANGKGYVGLGYNRNDIGTTTNFKQGAKDFWEYDPTTNKWTQITDFPGTARYNAVAFTLNDKGYVGTGYDLSLEGKSDMYMFDPISKTWSNATSFRGGKRERAHVVVMNGKAYMGGGLNNGNFQNDYWSFDGTEWLPLRPNTDSEYYSVFVQAVNKNYAVSFYIDNKIYIATGVNNSGANTKTCFEFDPTANTWKQMNDFEGAARQGAVAFTLTLNGKTRGFIGTGSYYDDMWEFDPSTDKVDND